MKKIRTTVIITFLLVVSVIGALALAGCNRTPEQTNNNPIDNLIFVEQSDGTYGVKTTNKNIEGALVIPATHENKTVSVILESAFYDCTKLTSVVIPNGVKTIEKRAFCYCSSLTSVTVYPSLEEIKGEAFRGCGEFDYIHKGTNAEFHTSTPSSVFLDSTPKYIYQAN